MKKVIKNSEYQSKVGLARKIKDVPPVYVDVPPKGVIDKAVLRAKTEAHEIIEEARDQGQRIRDEAEKILSQVEEVRKKAREEGLAQGREEGLGQLTERFVSFEAAKEKFFSESEPNIKKLVLACVEKVIGKLAGEHEDVVNQIVRQAIESALGERIVVRLNPEDIKTISKDQFEFKDILGYTKRIYFKEDDTITKGGCVVETEVGTVDARIETQLKAIRKALEL